MLELIKAQSVFTCSKLPNRGSDRSGKPLSRRDPEKKTDFNKLSSDLHTYAMADPCPPYLSPTTHTK